MKKVIVLIALIVAMVNGVNASNAQSNNPVESTTAWYGQQSASLTIKNKSGYTMTIKLMNAVTDSHYQTIYISSYSERTVYFSTSGSYYIKMKAEKGIETMYKKDSPFSIQCDDRGYSQATIEYYVSSNGGSNAGRSISKAEFERNY